MLRAEKWMEQIQKRLPKAKLQPPANSNPFGSGEKRAPISGESAPIAFLTATKSI
jgi:hypothetical protein